MADGSVIIGVGLDLADFTRQSISLEAQVAALGAKLNGSMAASVGGVNIGAAFSESLQYMNTAMAEMALGMIVTMREMANGCFDAFRAIPWESGGRGAMSEIGAGITAGRASVSAAVAQSAVDAAVSFQNRGWQSIGQNIMAGIAEGIRRAGMEVVEAIREVSAEADGAVREYYGISSPSAKMRDEVGVMISRGIAEGILDGSSFVDGAMESVRGRAEFGTPMGSAGGSVTQNIYLRDDDSSPYRTARRIRRESEAIFRL